MVLYKVVNLGSGVRLSRLSTDISHVVMGDKEQTVFNALKQLDTRYSLLACALLKRIRCFEEKKKFPVTNLKVYFKSAKQQKKCESNKSIFTVCPLHMHVYTCMFSMYACKQSMCGECPVVVGLLQSWGESE